MPLSLPDILKPKSLQQRTVLFILIPVLCILLLVGLVGLMLVRSTLIDQWQQAAIAKLSNSASMVDQRLGRPKRILMLFQGEAGKGMNRQVADFLLNRIRNLDGVMDVKLEWLGETSPVEADADRPGRRNVSGIRYHRMGQLEVSLPSYDAAFKDKTVSLVSNFHDEGGNLLGRIEVTIAFYDLIGELFAKDSSWASEDLFLVDQNGNVLTRSAFLDERKVEQLEKFGGFDELEKRTLEQLRQKDYGTVFGPGMPPEEVSGFYRLKEAPWTLVVVTSGELILEPILRFRFYFLLTGLVGLALALLLIRIGTTSTTRAIQQVSDAANRLATGDFSAPLEVRSRDEVGQLTSNFNIMISQLQERMRLQEAMGIAREVQQNLLPRSSYRSGRIAVSGASVYCQETGGDYFDVLPDPDIPGRVSVVVADVVGHGIGAALLMATIRALVRCRTAIQGEPVEMVTDVNTLLCQDTENSGNFVTLFYCVVDQELGQIQWVRCGHDPAIVYDPEADSFSELRGEGLVLGFDSGYRFQQNSVDMPAGERIILIGSDGVWDAESATGERYGRERVRRLIAAEHQLPGEEIIAAITRDIERFSGSGHQSDDITLVVIKVHR